MTTRIPRHATKVFYATEATFRTQPDGTVARYAGREQRSTTFREARKFLDDLNAPGKVTVWSALSNRTWSYADRAADGTWTGVDRLTGNRVTLPAA